MMKKQLKKICAINDLSGYGQCSLGIVIPVLSAASLEVCALPTAFLSAHTAIEGFVKTPTDDFFDEYVSSWFKAGVKMDAIYSGYMCSKKQIFSTLQLFADNKNALKFVDPVLGDNGKTYKTFNGTICSSMKKLVSKSDYCFPNYTEACILLDKKYSSKPKIKDVESTLKKLQKMGAKNIVITGIRFDDKIYNFILDDKGKVYSSSSKYYDVMIHGAGDLFSSCVVACIMNGKSLRFAVSFATKYLEKAVKFSITQKDHKRKGINFEPFLYKLTDLIER